MARVDRAARVAKGQRGAAADVPAQRLILTGRVSGSNGRFEPALASGCPEDCGEACGPMHAVPRVLLLGVGSSVDRHTLVEHRSLAPSPLGRVQDGEGRSGSKGGEGEGRQSMSTQAGLLFQPTTPALAAATISKMPLNPLLLPAAHNSTGSATTINLPINEIYHSNFKRGRSFVSGRRRGCCTDRMAIDNQDLSFFAPWQFRWQVLLAWVRFRS